MAHRATVVLGMTRGRRSLLALLQLTAALNIAARLRCSHAVVSMWAAGYRRPGPHRRAQLEQIYGIRSAHWDMPIVSRRP